MLYGKRAIIKILLTIYISVLPDTLKIPPWNTALKNMPPNAVIQHYRQLAPNTQLPADFVSRSYRWRNFNWHRADLNK